MEKWLRKTVDATLFCNGATPEQKYHAVVADTAHGVHVSCLGFEKAYVSVEDLSERRGTVWATPTVGPPPCRGSCEGPWTSPVTVSTELV